MLRRNLRHALRYPSLTLATLLIPMLILLLFVGVYGEALGAGIGGASYIAFVAPAIILMAATSGSVSTAVSVALDMSEGIINRFRTMPIARASVLTGHVVGSVLQTLISIGLLIGVAVLMGFRPTADVVEWVAAVGLLTLVTLALTWLSAGAGLAAKSVEAASNLPTPRHRFLGQQIDALELIGYDPATDTFPSTVFSGFSPTPLPDRWDVRGDRVTITVAYAPLDATFTGSWGEDGTFSGGWRAPTPAPTRP